MATRVNLSIIYAVDDFDEPITVELQANSHHPDVDFKEIVKKMKKLKNQPTAMLREVLAINYPSDHGAHKAGQPVFLLGVPHPDPDFDITLI